jgi:ABC-type sugar transport system permease subunit
VRTRRTIRLLPFIAPVHVLILSVIVLPALYVAWLSLMESSYGQASVFVGLSNFRRVLGDPAFRSALWNTVVLVMVAVHVELLLGLLLALLFASGLPFRRVLLVCTLAPYAVSEVIAVVSWRYLFDPDAGPVTQLLLSLGLPVLDWSFEPVHAMILIALLTIWLHLPFTFIILYAARLAIPTDLYEAARIDGARPWQAFRRVTLPLLGPAIVVALLFRYIFAFRIFSEVWLLTGGGPARTTEVVAVYLYREAFTYNAFGTATATAWIMVLASLLLALGYVALLRRQVTGNAH